MSTITPPASNRYQDFLRDIKTQVAQSRLGAARAVNRSLIGLYWSLGKMIVERQEELGWGSAVVDQLSADLRNEFPDMSGFSPRNLWDIKRFYETYSSAPEFLRQLVAEIPWGQNILIFQRIKDEAARRFRLDQHGLAVIIYAMHGKYIPGEIDSCGDIVHGLPLSWR